MEKREKFDIMIKTKASQDQIASYLVKAVLGLRDRENKSESVRLFGGGSAIPNVILVAEIIRARYKGLSSIVTLENMEKEINENGQVNKISIPAIRIKLTCKPTQEELNQAFILNQFLNQSNLLLNSSNLEVFSKGVLILQGF
ncbi:unnamed protein product [Paramecium sonneborni]|uniref:DNA/RNA-binding protein Alba-like domain-containing protein n=1 Tax=Paramecium sonneborni TaxID=65129 RepID=A0A8S1N850_9CILI|nr:unnamed protein product [Paramecium sonneborni]